MALCLTTFDIPFWQPSILLSFEINTTMKPTAFLTIMAGFVCIPGGYMMAWLSARRGPDGEIVKLVAGDGLGWIVAGYTAAVMLVVVGLSMLRSGGKRCGNCGGELKMRSFRALDDTCPHCGGLRHSTKTIATATRVRFSLVGLGICLVLEFFLGVPQYVSIPLLFCPFAVWVWFYYRPFAEGTTEAGEDDVEEA